MKVTFYPLVCMMLFLVGCGRSTTNSLPADSNTSTVINSGGDRSSLGGFQNLVRGDAYSAGLETPALFIAGNLDEATNFSNLVDKSEDIKKIQEVDFETHWVVAVFRGEVGTAGYGISIDDIKATDKGVRLQVSLSDPGPDEAVAQVVSYPYHLVTIPRDDLQVKAESVWTVYASDEKMLTEARYPDRENELEGGDKEDTGDIVSHGGAARDYVSLIDNLRSYGAEVEPSGEISQPFFEVKGMSILVNGASVQVFEYANSETAGAQAATVSEGGTSVGTSMLSWVSAPRFYLSERIIVLYVGTDAVAIDALTQVLGNPFAGPETITGGQGTTTESPGSNEGGDTLIGNNDTADDTVSDPTGSPSNEGSPTDGGPATSGSTGTTSSSDGLTGDDEQNDGRLVPIGTYTGDDEPVSSDDPRVKPLPPPIVPGNNDGGITNPRDGGPLPPVGKKLDIRGSVSTISEPSSAGKARGILGSVLIEGSREDDTNFDKALVTITESTRILHWDGQELHESSFSLIKAGQSVEVRFLGPVMESYPVQATAMEIGVKD
jgi:hypothetical protein